MKKTLNTHACSLAGEGAAVYSLARGVAAAVTGGLGTRLSAKQKQQPSAGLA